MSKTLIMVNRTLLGAGVHETYAGRMKPDYKKLLRVLAPDEKDPLRRMWGLDMPPAVVTLLTDAGWIITNHKKHVTGLVECEMSVCALVAPGEVRRFIFVAPSSVVLPAVTVLVQDGCEVIVAGYRRDTAFALLNAPGALFVDLAEVDILRAKDWDRNYPTSTTEGKYMRSISVIAAEIRRDWKKVHYTAEPYLQAMHQLESFDDRLGVDDARGIVLRFLGNATTWRGEVAKRIKAELKEGMKR